MHLKSDDGLPMSMMLQPLLSIVWSFGIIFCICEFGERLTLQFIAFDRQVWQTKWYSMPTELQRMLLVLIANAQQPAFLKSYGNIECTRDSFKMVWRLLCHRFVLNTTLISFGFIRQFTRDIHILCCCVKCMTRLVAIIDSTQSLGHMHVHICSRNGMNKFD